MHRKEDIYINFTAQLKDEKHPVGGFIHMEMYPEGLTVQSSDTVLRAISACTASNGYISLSAMKQLVK